MGITNKEQGFFHWDDPTTPPAPDQGHHSAAGSGWPGADKDFFHFI